MFRLLDMSPEVSAVSAEPESHSGTGGAAGPRRFAGHLRRGPQRPDAGRVGLPCGGQWVSVRPADSRPKGPRAAEWEPLGPVQA